MRLLFAIALVNCSFSISQEIEDTTINIQQIPNVEISIQTLYIRYSRERNNVLRRKEIEELQATDIGELLQKFEGTTIKSYGGLGGLKTVAIRSLGSQHSAVCVDGFNLLNNQTGQINLGQLQTINVEQVAVGISNQPHYLLPVTSQIAGNSLLIETFENRFTRDTLALRMNIKHGAFGRFSGYGSVKRKMGQGFISAYGNFQSANGIYPYRIENGLQIDSSERSNNDYQDYYVGMSFGTTIKKTRFRIGYKQKGIKQGLPGAVILYNSSADERLNTQDQSLFSDAKFEFKNNWYIRAYVSANKNVLNYFDPTYLNSQGFVDVSYKNRSLNSGIIVYAYKSKWQFHGGVENTISDLVATDTLFAKPVRHHYSAIVGSKYSWPYVIIKGHVSTQIILEKNLQGDDASDKTAFNPYLSVESKEIGQFFHRHKLWYKSSFRMPSFNELYYNNVGNNLLVPERANQFGYNLSFVPVESRTFDWHVRAGVYYNQVRDKIFATPTKNLFVWSMQNLGKVDIYGGEIVSKFSYTFRKNRSCKIKSYVTYSIQRSLDMTDSDHPTYGHQIAYVPIHTVNFDFSFEYKNFGFRASNYYVSKRYSLNENISANEVDAFIISDLSFYQKFVWKKKHKITIQVSVKNIFDNSYAYIRSFVMPGRNYLISLSYAIN